MSKLYLNERLVGCFEERSAARDELRRVFDKAWFAHEFPAECWVSDCQSPEENPDCAWIVSKFSEDPKLCLRITE